MVAVLVMVFSLQLLSSTTTLGLHTSTNIPSSSSSVNRRKLIFGGCAAAAAAASCLPHQANAAVSSPFEQPSLQQSGGYSERVQGIGGGFDMLGDDNNRKPIATIDILYPPSLNGTWVCERKVVSAEGDVNQAQGAWKLLGGTVPVGGGGREDFQKVEEKYFVRFVDLRRPTDGIIGLDGKKYYGDILDRGYEIEERTGSGSGGSNGSGEAAKPPVVQWDPRAPNTLKYERNDGSPATELKVVQRSVEPQNNRGSLVGSNELIRVTTKASIYGSNFDITYATRVQRRWRRTTTDEGDRVVEGIEIQKTYRVLDGIAGIEDPTSTVKSILRLTRTYPTRASAATAAALPKSNNDDDTTAI